MTLRWSDELTTAFMSLVSEGLSSTNIAKALTKRFGREFTRSQVLGKARRSKVTLAMPAHRPSKAKTPKLKAPTMVEINHAVHFIDRRNTQCPYPLWQDDERIGMVCGVPKEAWSQYCACHQMLCFGAWRSNGQPVVWKAWQR